MGRIFLTFCFLVIGASEAYSQEIEQYQVFAGRYDYVAFGNTMNLVENGIDTDCTILTSSSADFELSEDQSIIAAYLYWAGSGTGDLEVLLNDNLVTAQRVFSDQIDDTRVFFAAFADVTEILQNSTSDMYTLSELDISDVIDPFCPTGTNFAGWAVAVIYEDLDLPLNVVNVFDGLESVSAIDTELTIQLENLNVLDNEGAKIGFIAWEGDSGIAVNETLSINGNTLSNPPLNPEDNQFNGTNSFTGASDLYNMDLDVYDIENNIDVGDTSAEITLTSGQDFVMINSIITVLNSQLPDAIIDLITTATECENRALIIDYLVSNVGTDILPAGTPVTFYADDDVIVTVETPSSIPIGDSLELNLSIDVPDTLEENFSLTAVVDDDGTGQGTVNETNESNNVSQAVDVVLGGIALDLPLLALFACDQEDDEIEFFDLTTIGDQAIINDTSIVVSYHLTDTDAQQGVNEIENPSAFEVISGEFIVFIRFVTDDGTCQRVESTTLSILSIPEVPVIDALEQCDDLENDGIGIFDFSQIVSDLSTSDEELLISFYETESDAVGDQNPLQNINAYENSLGQNTIFVRLSRAQIPDCFDIGMFLITVVPQEVPVLLPDLTSCNLGFETALFDLTEIEDNFDLETDETITGYYTSEEDANLNTLPIEDIFEYENLTNPQTIFVRTDASDDAVCPQFAQFDLRIENCPPFVPDGFSPNNDGMNDLFEITGLKDVYPNHSLRIYTRLGNLVYEGSQETEFWDGTPNRGVLGTEVPVGVYYWILRLNDDQIGDLSGWVYLNR